MVANRSSGFPTSHEWFEFVTTQMRWLGPMSLINIDIRDYLKRQPLLQFSTTPLCPRGDPLRMVVQAYSLAMSGVAQCYNAVSSFR